MTDKKEAPGISVEMLAEALAKAMRDSGPDAVVQTGMSRERIDRVLGKHDKPIRQRVIKGKSPDTGATFDMVVLESRAPTHKHGRVVRLENYRHPKEAYIPQTQGGLLPDGSQVWRDGKPQGDLCEETPGTALTPFFKQWRYDTFWKPDLQRLANGAPLRLECCVEGAKALEIPWTETSLFADEAAE